MRWAPLVLGFVACLAMFAAFSTPLTSVFEYSLYLLVTAVVPGTLLWRMLRTRPRSFLEEVVAGTTLGITVQTGLAWVLTRLGEPRLAVAWVVIVVGLCVVHPRLRGFWRSQADARNTPIWLGWALSALSVVALWWVVNNDWPGQRIAQIPGMPGQWFAVAPVQDVTFQQGLVAAVLRGATHFPSTAAAPLKYELMASYQMADAARWTDIDLTVLVFRLTLVPLVILAVLLCGVIAHRLTKSAGGATLGAGFAYFTQPAPLWAALQYPLSTAASLNVGVFRSATQTFVQPLFLMLILLLIVIVTRKGIDYLQLVIFAGAAFVVGGSKATMLPELLCGLAAALIVGWFLRSGRSWRLIGLAVLTVVLLVASLVLVLGTGSRGLSPSLLVTATHWTAIADLTHTAVALRFSIPKALFLGIGWFLGVSAAVLAVVFKRRSLGIWILAGVGAAGLGGTLLTKHPSFSQIWFMRGAWPVLGTLAGIGIYEAIKALHIRRRVSVAVIVVSLLLGLLGARVVRHFSHLPTVYEFQKTWIELFLPYLALFAIAVAIAIVLVVLCRVPVVRRHAKLGGVVALGLVIGVVALQGSGASEFSISGLLPLAPNDAFPAVSADGAYTARWVREHSSTDAVLATNMHCVGTVAEPNAEPSTTSWCTDARHFWLGALSERQVLLEGWAYASPPKSIDPDFNASVSGSIFWDPAYLHENDAAITASTSSNVGWLRAHHVSWIVVDRAISRESPLLVNYASLELVRGSFAVYRLNAG